MKGTNSSSEGNELAVVVTERN